MISNDAMTGDFQNNLKSMLPRLRVYGLSLTHDRDRANDLVQQTVMKALAGRGSFQPDTNFGTWLFRIQRNEFVSGMSRTASKPRQPFDKVVLNSLTHATTQENGTETREFLKAFGCLTTSQREALVLAVLEGLSYEDIAAHCSVSVGTVKIRISRAQTTLSELLTANASARGACAPASPVAQPFPAAAVVGHVTRPAAGAVNTVVPMNQKPASPVEPDFEQWLHSQLHNMYDSVAQEPLHDELRALVEPASTS